MSVQVEEFPTSPLSRARSPTDRDYSSLEEEEPDSYTEADIFSFSVEGLDSPYNSSDEDAIISGADIMTAPKQRISFISQMTLIFYYPQSASLSTAQTKPQSVAELNSNVP